jgi:hypothetical protein
MIMAFFMKAIIQSLPRVAIVCYNPGMKRNLSFFIGIILCGLLISNTPPVFAAKKKVKKTTAVTQTVSYSQAKLSRNTNSVVINFQNLDKITKISYELSYIATGIPQGVAGTITPSNTSDQRDLYFGTCSKGVCTPHTNIVNAQLIIRAYLKSGSTYTKLYRIKI